MTHLPTIEDLAFKPVPEGFLFAPGVALLGNSLGCRLGRSYVLNAAQKADVAAELQRYNAIIRTVCRTYAVVAATIGVMALSLLTAPGLLPKVPMSLSREAVSAILLGVVMAPFALTMAWFGFALRRILAGAPHATESLTAVDVFSAELAALPKTRLKLQVSAGTLIVIVSASHVLDGIMDGSLASKGVWLFTLAVGAYLATHYSMLLMAKRALKGAR